ncbi:MAG TPA: 2-C-methyl-D-erythritol 2,4-cyclodiphosphate synthase [Spirochaetota bacterium]|nr:2-C-methyl-D-erythritol 2,4-cyclodiphosphate synthase [Spirochaetota bacterium]
MNYQNYRSGIGFDAHRLIEGRKLILGGVHIPFDFGLSGHSDADVVTHAIIDALLGASSMGDIGRLYPDTSQQFKDTYSIDLLHNTYLLLLKNNITIINIDSIILCQKPKIVPYIEEMKNKLSMACGNMPVANISMKGKTTEGMGFTGTGEGIAALATCLIYFNK